MKGRSLQLKGIDLYLQAARLEPKLRPQLDKRMGPAIDVSPRKEVEAPAAPPVEESKQTST